MTCEELGTAVAIASVAIAKAGEIIEKAFRETEQAITLWALARNKCYKSNNERKRNKEPMIREKAYIKAYRNKCRRRNVREIHTLDREVQKEEV